MPSFKDQRTYDYEEKWGKGEGGCSKLLKAEEKQYPCRGSDIGKSYDTFVDTPL